MSSFVASSARLRVHTLREEREDDDRLPVPVYHALRRNDIQAVITVSSAHAS